MRVIAGTAKRLQLKTLDGMETRPTTDTVSYTHLQNPLEFFSVLLLKQHIFEDAGLFVVGLADGYEGALELTEEIVQDVYQKTNDVRLREFILNNQKQSGEGSV